MTAPWPCNARQEHFPPTLGKTCGRRERESRREGRRSASLRKNDSFACRDGERHPGLPEGGVLRGASSERRPWSVRPRVAASSAATRRAGDSGCPEGAEEGNVVGMRTKRMHPTQAREIVACAWETRPSLGPSTRARQSSLHTCGAIRRWRGVRFGITVGQTRASGRNQHWGRSERTERGSPRVTAPSRNSARPRAHRRRRRGTSEKEGGRGLRPCEDTGAPVWLPARRSSLQKSVGDVSSRISSANALQKERPGSSEQGPSSGRTPAGGTVGG